MKDLDNLTCIEAALWKNAAAFPGKTAVASGGESVSYGDLIGRILFAADRYRHLPGYVCGGRIVLAPAAKAAFAQGSAAARDDYSDAAKLRDGWRTAVLAEAKLEEGALAASERMWLAKALETEIENVRLDARGVQRALAARLQRQWIENPAALKDVTDVGALADALKAKSLGLVAEEIGSEVLP